jgi:hypothetical protein
MTRQLHVLKLSDEFGHYRLHIGCLSCANKRIVDPADLAPRVGWECTLEILSKRLRCGKCGAKGARIEVGPMSHQREPKWH